MLSSWSKRSLTTVGTCRITVIKTLIIPNITHLLINLPDPPSKTILEIKEIYCNKYGILKHIK